MREDQPHNIAIAEVRHNGRIARITGSAATEDEDAIQNIVNLLAREGIDGDCVLRLYSERQPSPEWCRLLRGSLAERGHHVVLHPR